MSEKLLEQELSVPDKDIAELGQTLEKSRQEEQNSAEILPPAGDAQGALDEIIEEYTEKNKTLGDLRKVVEIITGEMDALYGKLEKLAELTGLDVNIPSTEEGENVAPVAPKPKPQPPKPQAPKPQPPKSFEKAVPVVTEIPVTAPVEAEAKTIAVAHPSQPLEMGQVILEAKRPVDKASEKAFASTDEDKRTSRRASMGYSQSGDVYGDAPRELPGAKAEVSEVKVEEQSEEQPEEQPAPAVEDNKVETPVVEKVQPEKKAPLKKAEAEVEDGRSDIKSWLGRRGLFKRKEPGETPELVKVETLFDKTSEADDKKSFELKEKVESVKKWFSGAREKYGVHYWNAKWMAAKEFMGTAKESVLNYGVTETMIPFEQEERRKKNRRNVMIGGSVLAVLAIGAGLVRIEEAAEAAANAPAGLDHADQMKDTLLANRAQEIPVGGGAEQVPVADAFVPNVEPAYNIPDGKGGLDLFSKLNLSPDVWHANEGILLQNFPDDFYLEPGRGVLITNPGFLSPEAQQFIESLR